MGGEEEEEKGEGEDERNQRKKEDLSWREMKGIVEKRKRRKKYLTKVKRIKERQKGKENDARRN